MSDWDWDMITGLTVTFLLTAGLVTALFAVINRWAFRRKVLTWRIIGRASVAVGKNPAFVLLGIEALLAMPLWLLLKIAPEQPQEGENNNDQSHPIGQ